MKIFEIVDPTTKFSSQAWYHGTPSSKGYQHIMKNGLAYDGDWVKQKYQTERGFAPMKDGVYITKDLGNAYRFTLMPQNVDATVGPDPFGYIFKFPGAQLQSISNDEDEIGMHIVKNIEQYPELKTVITPEIVAGANDNEHGFKYIAMAGKLALQHLSKDKVGILLNTLHSRNIVHYGKLDPISVIKVPKISPDEQKTLVPQNATSFQPFTDFVDTNGKETQLS